MQTILLIRHAIAKDREDWSGDDALRPLTARGRRQAEAISEKFGSLKLAEIRSSPAVRCVGTVEPLARRAEVKITLDDGLREGSMFSLGPVDDRVIAYCAHGDNIPALLDDLDLDGGRCKKGSVWTIKRAKPGRIVQASYFVPGE
jgi:8-oxo-dGTP diphosphatase